MSCQCSRGGSALFCECRDTVKPAGIADCRFRAQVIAEINDLRQLGVISAQIADSAACEVRQDVGTFSEESCMTPSEAADPAVALAEAAS